MNGVRRAARLVAQVVVMEARLYHSLALWMCRRRTGLGDGATAVGYSQLVSPVMGLWIFASALEIPLFHVITPWESVRLVLDVVGIWGLLWMLGMLASLTVHPHVVDARTLRLRYGVFADVSVPWSAVARLRVAEQTWPSSVRITQHGPDDALAVAVSGRTNVVAELSGPTALSVNGVVRAVSSVAFWVDEPREFSREHRTLLPGGAAGGQPQ